MLVFVLSDLLMAGQVIGFTVSVAGKLDIFGMEVYIASDENVDKERVAEE